MKKALCLFLSLACAFALSGCSTPLDTPSAPVSTLPPAVSPYEAPVGDASLEYTATIPLFLPSRDGQTLLAQPTPVSLHHGRRNAESLVRALLTFEGNDQVSALGGGVTLQLYGQNPVEVSGGVCTVNLTSSALQLSASELYTVALSLSATLCQQPDIHYVNLLVADQALGMDITNHLPLGSLTVHPGVELPVLWEQMEARRTPLGEDPADTPFTSAVTLYFPLADASGVIPEARNLSFPGQTPDQLATVLISALSTGAQYLQGAAAIPDLSLLMSAAPHVEALDNGGRRVNLYFHVSWEDTLRQAGVDAACLVSALTYTLTGFIPSLSDLRIHVGETPLTSLYSAQHGSQVFADGLITRAAFSAYVMDHATLYFASGDKLSATRRAMPYYEAANPRLLLLRLMDGPTRQELDRGLEPVLPEGLQDSDILGVSLSGDTLLVNLSVRCAELIRQEAASWEQAACYGMVNTLCSAMGVKRVRFFFGGEVLSTLGGTLYWGGEFLHNPGLNDKSLG